MRTIKDTQVLCSESSKVGDSAIISIINADELSVSIVLKEGTVCKISFWVSIDSKNWHEIECNCSKDGSTFMISTTTSGLYSFDVSTGCLFKMKIDEITSGSVSAYGASFILN